MPSLHCIFDLDGTLFDSHSQIINAVAWTRRRHGLQDLNDDEIGSLIGLPASYLFADVKSSGVEIAELVSNFRDRLMVEIMNPH